MGKLVRATVWAKTEFEKGSIPGKEKVERWILDKVIPGKILDGEPYVDADRFAIQEPNGAANDTSTPTSGLELLA